MQRDTRQRRAIRMTIQASDRPLSPQEIHEAAQEHVPGLGIATVYRTLNGLVKQGWLLAVELPGEPPRYERADKGHHHHFYCRACERVYEVEGCPGDFSDLAPDRFSLENHVLVLYGLCEACHT